MEVVTQSFDKKDTNRRYEVVCNQCTSTIQFLRNEALTITPSLTEEYLTIMCPECNAHVVKVVNNKIDEREVVVSDFNRYQY